MKDDKIYYSIGALLYSPANNKRIVKSIISEKFGKHYSMALCLEDTINDNFVEEAEAAMTESLLKIKEASKSESFYIPKIFIRVRSSKQIKKLMKALGEAQTLVTGFIIPKFVPETADEYIDQILDINKEYNRTIYSLKVLQ